MFKGVKMYGAEKFAFKLSDDNMVTIWVDASLAPSEALVAEPNGKPWAIKQIAVYGTDDELGS